MKTNVLLCAAVSISFVGGCGLVKVNGKPVSLGSSSSSSSSNSDPSGNSSESSAGSTPNATPASASQQAGDADVEAKKDKKYGVWKSPAWCKNAESLMDKWNRPSSTNGYWDDLDRDDPAGAVRTLVGAYCFPDDYARRDIKIVEAGYKKWSAKLGMNEADWADAVEWTSIKRGSDPKAPDAKTSWRKWSPIDQYIALQNTGWIDETYVADALDKQLTTLGHLGYVAKCIDSEREAFWAMCQADFDAIDRKAVLSELRADKSHSAYEKMTIRFALPGLFARLDAHAKRVKELKAKDPGWAKMFEAAAAGRKEWAAKADPKLVDLVFEMDDARVTKSRKASQGCHDKTWPALQAIIAAIPAKTFAELKRDTIYSALAVIVDSPNGYLASLAHFYCSTYDAKQDYLARTIGRQLQNSIGYRGPRNAAYTAIASAGIVLDDRDEKISYPPIERPIHAEGSSLGASGHGKVASVKKDGNTVVISFANEKFSQEECVKGHYTHRIQSISSDGSINYQYKCEKLQMKTYSEPPSRPLTVNAIYAAGVSKGMFVDVVEDLVVFAYPKPGVSVPSIVAGVQVK